MKLIIVESPNKCHTIESYLGKDYKVIASIGHIRDLSTTGKGGLGIDIANDFKPTYVVSKDKESVVAALKREAKKADEIYLATDPDREGEAISWHLANVLKLDIDTAKRLEFNEITKTAILKAIENPRTIDKDLVASQETRRIIDRIMGFKLSALMKKKLGSLSAGRVQSVTLRLLTEREKEVLEFVPTEYWTIGAEFGGVPAALESFQGNKVVISNEESANRLINDLPKEFVVSEQKVVTRNVNPQYPFRTSTLYAESHLSATTARNYAQKLFELGLITYFRTEGHTLAKEFIDKATNYISEKYGDQYVAPVARLKSLENKGNTASAHEAVRPTSLDNTPEKVKAEYKLTPQMLGLYRLIYNRSIAALMAQKVEEVTTFKIEGNGFVFTTGGAKMVFDGFTRVYSDGEEKASKVPNLKKDEKCEISNASKEQHFTKGPSRYTEAKLIKTMEDLGIGRPSTYASTIETLYKRDYMKKEETKEDGKKGVYLVPTQQGITTVENLCKFFPPFMETSYTAEMEKELDEVSVEDGTRSKILHEFYDLFDQLFVDAQSGMEKEQPRFSGGVCPQCGKLLVYRKSKYGEFEACSGYPECNYVKKPEKEPLVYSDKLCPQCGKPLVLRKSKKGEFYACSGFPKCHYIEGQEQAKPVDEVTDILCPKCGKPLLRKKGKAGKSDFYGCSNFPKCHYIQAIKEEKTKE